ncbi:MAG TPA: tetratricopeptide repeat protein [Parasegetibacter sp.]
MSDKTKVQTSQEADIQEKAIGFWEQNGKKVLIFAGIIVVGVIGYMGYRSYVVEPKENKAQEAMFKAEEFFKNDSLNLALNGDGMNAGFLKIIDRHSGTKAANLANYYAGVCYLKTGDFENAIKYLSRFTTDSKLMLARKHGLLGDAYSEAGKNEEAVAEYKKAGTTLESDQYLSSEYLFRAGYLLESLGKNKEAAEQYKIIKKKYPNTQRGYDVDKYLARLGDI